MKMKNGYHHLVQMIMMMNEVFFFLSFCMRGMITIFKVIGWVRFIYLLVCVCFFSLDFQFVCFFT